MKKYELVVSNNAIDDIEKIYNYIYYAYYSPEYSDRFKKRIIKAIESLKIMPYRNERMKYGRYKMRVNSYLLIYTVSEEKRQVYIKDVIYQKRNK